MPSTETIKTGNHKCDAHLLLHHPNLPPQPPNIQILQIHTIQLYTAHRRVIKPLHQFHDGTLPTPTHSNQRNSLAALDLQVEILENLHIFPSRILESHVLKLDFAGDRRRRLTGNVVKTVNGRDAVDGGEDLHGGTLTLAEEVKVWDTLTEGKGADEDQEGYSNDIFSLRATSLDFDCSKPASPLNVKYGTAEADIVGDENTYQNDKA